MTAKEYAWAIIHKNKLIPDPSVAINPPSLEDMLQWNKLCKLKKFKGKIKPFSKKAIEHNLKEYQKWRDYCAE